jgi:hypothetical protein
VFTRRAALLSGLEEGWSASLLRCKESQNLVALSLFTRGPQRIAAREKSD